MWDMAMRGEISDGGVVLLCELRGAGAPGSPVAADPDDRRRRRWPAVAGRSTGSIAPIGRPSIPPEKLLRALLLQAFYSVRSERQLMEQLDYNLLFRWFVGLAMDAPIWDATVFTKNRERLLDGDVAAQLHGGGAGPAPGQGAALGRALLGRWHAD